MKKGTKSLVLPNGVTQTLAVYVPESLDSSLPPLLFIPGFGSTNCDAFEEFLGTITTFTGRKVYALAHTNAFQTVPQGDSPPIPSNFQKWKQLVAFQTARKLAENSKNGLDIVGYSEGAMYALYIAYSLNRIGNLYLLNPAGITGKESHRSIILRVARNQIDMLCLGLWGIPEAKRRLKIHKKSIRAYLKRKSDSSTTQSGLRKVFGQIRDMYRDMVAPGRVDLEDIVRFLAHYGRRIRIHGFEDDAMIPARVLKKRYQGVPNIPLTMDRGTHQQVLVNPEEIAKILMTW